MGMDVFGIAPKSEAGKYFRANIWSWRPIHNLIAQTGVLPDEIVYGMSFNDGIGPGDELAVKLADALELVVEGMNDENEFILPQEIDGPVAEMIRAIRTHNPSVFVDDKPLYTTDVAHVREFITFCRESGGFEVC